MKAKVTFTLSPDVVGFIKSLARAKGVTENQLIEYLAIDKSREFKRLIHLQKLNDVRFRFATGEDKEIYTYIRAERKEVESRCIDLNGNKFVTKDNVLHPVVKAADGQEKILSHRQWDDKIEVLW